MPRQSVSVLSTLSKVALLMLLGALILYTCLLSMLPVHNVHLLSFVGHSRVGNQHLAMT